MLELENNKLKREKRDLESKNRELERQRENYEEIQFNCLKRERNMKRELTEKEEKY